MICVRCGWKSVQQEKKTVFLKQDFTCSVLIERKMDSPRDGNDEMEVKTKRAEIFHHCCLCMVFWCACIWWVWTFTRSHLQRIFNQYRILLGQNWRLPFTTTKLFLNMKLVNVSHFEPILIIVRKILGTRRKRQSVARAIFLQTNETILGEKFETLFRNQAIYELILNNNF